MARTRYSNIKLKKNIEGKTHYEGSLYPTIPPQANDKYIYTKFGDRLDSLSLRYFGATQYWWILAQANNIMGTLSVKPGTHLRIPNNWGNVLKEYEELNLKG